MRLPLRAWRKDIQVRKIVVVAALLSLFALTACGSNPIDESGKVRIAELEARQFENIILEEAQEGDFFSSAGATANVSVGDCRLTLSWSERRGWQVVVDEDVDFPEGELNAELIKATKAYDHCSDGSNSDSAPS